MNRVSRAAVRASALAALVAVGCSSGPPGPLPVYPAPKLASSGVDPADPGAAPTWTVDAGRSRIEVHVRGKGFLATHDHLFVPRAWAGRAAFDPEAPERAKVELEVVVASLHDEEPGMSESTRREVDANAKAPEVLDAERFPRVRFVASRLERPVRPASPNEPRSLTGTLVGELELHGVKRPLRLPVRASWDDASLTATGSVTFEQSAFGITPVSKLFGAAAIHDAVTVSYRVVAARDR